MNNLIDSSSPRGKVAQNEEIYNITWRCSVLCELWTCSTICRTKYSAPYCPISMKLCMTAKFLFRFYRPLVVCNQAPFLNEIILANQRTKFHFFCNVLIVFFSPLDRDTLYQISSLSDQRFTRYSFSNLIAPPNGKSAHFFYLTKKLRWMDELYLSHTQLYRV